MVLHRVLGALALSTSAVLGAGSFRQSHVLDLTASTLEDAVSKHGVLLINFYDESDDSHDLEGELLRPGGCCEGWRITVCALLLQLCTSSLPRD
jgi:hypothetical protein